MEQIVVKTEMEESGEILLFYVNESDGAVEGVEGSVTTIDNLESMGVQIQDLPTDATYIMQDVDDEEATEDTMNIDTNLTSEQIKERWAPEEINRLLIFYVDNKENFMTGNTKKKHLWSICCKTMLSGKNATSCEIKLRNMKRKYAQYLINQHKGVVVNFPYLDLCHKAFYDDSLVNAIIKESIDQDEPRLVKLPEECQKTEEPPMIVKSIKINKNTDDKVELMFNLYLKYKKDMQKDIKPKDLWEQIAIDIGEEDGEYWHKRFFNYKHHYLKMLNKRATSGSESIQWPYMSLCDQIFRDDEEFQRKYVSTNAESAAKPIISNLGPYHNDDWNITEITVLVKYYFDCYDEFQDLSIPDSFLWNEVGRLLDKKPDVCKNKFNEMKVEHLDKYTQGDYDIFSRVPVCILFDNIIAKDVQLEMDKDTCGESNVWSNDDLDELVKYFYDNIELFKDSVCHYVCWASIARKLNKSVKNCRLQWKDLTVLYKSILEDKKEYPDMQIDWKYIDLFDRIFDYGMDTSSMCYLTELNEKEIEKQNDSGKVAVKKLTVDLDENIQERHELWSDEDEYDERGFTKHMKRTFTQSKMFKILEYYLKNKDKFATTQKKRDFLWGQLGKQLGLAGSDCAQKFRHLKNMYTSYIRKEIEKPDIPIVWPFYTLCKKVFGYRALKSKLKNNKTAEDDWAAKEIKIIIRHFGENFQIILDNLNDSSVWRNVANEIGKSDISCMIKFNELKKAYQKMKKMKVMDPKVIIHWKYYSLIDEIFAAKGHEVDSLDVSMDDGDREQMEVLYEEDIKNYGQEEDDYQCIIVIPEGQDITNMEDAQIIIQNSQDMNKSEETVKNEAPTVNPNNKWIKRTKKRLLIHYLNYVRSRKSEVINPTEMWNEISTKLNKTPLSCRKMFAKLRSNHREAKNDVNKKKTPYFTLLEKILALKPKFSKTQKSLKAGKTFKDVPLAVEKVEQALRFYLLHIKEFNSPRFEKRHLWTELANFVGEPVTNVFNKVNYLKNSYNIETGEGVGQNTLLSELIKEIITEEITLKALAENDKVDVEDKTEYNWCDEEIEQLLILYLENLDQFKNPKYVRKYLWLDVSNVLKKSPLACSKKMSEIRTLYRNLVKENSEALNDWRFSSLCQKIYGTGKKEIGN
ncbi:uncharacterized protein LOC106137166 [Amyelois transitella]|uniref:uncharacterized protein LOC106137166 n=1 Tax=Amyelois transitella TaxID=680683 RepID=UPI00067A9578|nr:uncharacterized protein LOC106137166 [Amyelois transitella]XP_060807541.1 uncharacterized protein LOC106137166 [Amyelois transitella]